jgi:hypothetical protein
MEAIQNPPDRLAGPDSQEHCPLMNPRTIARVLLVVVLVLGAVGLGAAAYNAGVAQGAAAQAVSGGANVVVAPGAYAVAPYAGWGWGWGFGHVFFGFFGFLIFLFILFGLLRLAFGGGRGGWGPRHGYYGRGPNGWTDGEGRSWEDRARQAHDEWHRNQPDTPGSPTAGGQAG